MSFQCVYCDKEHDVKSNVFNLGGNVCKICAKLFGIEVLSIKVQTNEGDITYSRTDNRWRKDKNAN